MPTPAGKLKPRDRIIHKATGRVFTVVERLGNDINYSIRVVEEGVNRPSAIICTMGYLLKSGQYELYDPSTFFLKHHGT